MLKNYDDFLFILLRVNFFTWTEHIVLYKELNNRDKYKDNFSLFQFRYDFTFNGCEEIFQFLLYKFLKEIFFNLPVK